MKSDNKKATALIIFVLSIPLSNIKANNHHLKKTIVERSLQRNPSPISFPNFCFRISSTPDQLRQDKLSQEIKTISSLLDCEKIQENGLENEETIIQIDKNIYPMITFPSSRDFISSLIKFNQRIFPINTLGNMIAIDGISIDRLLQNKKGIWKIKRIIQRLRSTVKKNNDDKNRIGSLAKKSGAILLLALLEAACEPLVGIEKNKKQEPGNPAKSFELNLQQVASSHYTFYEFDNPLLSDGVIHLQPGDTLYQGTLYAHDGAKVPIHVLLSPSADIDRILIQINGGTGTDARFSLRNYNHKASVMVSMRGLHPEDIRQAECPLGTGLVNCLKNVPYLKQVNPKDNGKDVVNVMRIILGEMGRLQIDGRVLDHSFFGVQDRKFNMETGSYGATILGYALENPRLPAIGRIFIEGPSSPGEYVISDGLRNTNVAVHNMLDSIGMNETEKQNFLDVMKARHNSPRSTCDPSLRTVVNEDCLSSSMLFEYLQVRYEQIATSPFGINNQLESLKNELTDIPTTDATGTTHMNAVLRIYNSDGIRRHATSWEMSKWDILTSNGIITPDGIAPSIIPGFTSRIGQICSAYINRRDGDSQARFNAAKKLSSNNPFWYGFLIAYRDMLSICPRIARNLKTGIETPDASSMDVNVEAFVQYGAGTDEKHHINDMYEMASYIDSSSIIRNVYRWDHLQGGAGPRFSHCLFNLITATFDTETANLSTELDNIITSHCGLNP